MIINYKFRLKPTKEQKQKLEQQFFVSNQAWNYALNIRIKNLKTKNGFTPIKLIEKYIKTKLIIRNIPAHSGVTQMSVRNLEATFKQFFRRKRSLTEIGFPQFKKSNTIQQSFEFKNQSIKITKDYFQILKMKINLNYHRELPNNPKKVIIKREPDGNYFVIFS